MVRLSLINPKCAINPSRAASALAACRMMDTALSMSAWMVMRPGNDVPPRGRLLQTVFTAPQDNRIT